MNYLDDFYGFTAVDRLQAASWHAVCNLFGTSIGGSNVPQEPYPAVLETLFASQIILETNMLYAAPGAAGAKIAYKAG